MHPRPALWLVILLIAIPSPAAPRRETAGPPLVFSTYLGGSGTEVPLNAAVDAAGNTIVVGFTSSTDFPVKNAIQSTYGGGDFDIFVTKYNASGSVVFSTYLGGTARDVGQDVAVDAVGNIYVLGETRSENFPVTAGAYQTTNHSPGVDDDVVVRLSPNGDTIVYSTYLGGFASEDAFGLAVDAAGNAYIVGDTQGGEFPTTPGAFQQNFAGGNDAYVTKLNPTGSALVYSTFVGGQTSTDVFYDVAVDSAGNAFVSGLATAGDFPTASAIQPGFGGGARDAVVAELNAGGSALVFSTFLGGGGDDRGLALAIDSGGDAYVAGFTDSTDFPTAAPVQAANGGNSDAFVTKLGPSGGALVYSTYLGGTGGDFANAIAVDAQGNACVDGVAGAADFPSTADAFQPTFGGSGDAFLTIVNPAGTAFAYSTFLGGAGGEDANGITLGADGSLVLTGSTGSTDFPVQNPSQASVAGSADAYVTKFLFAAPAVAELSWDPPSASGTAPPTDLTARIVAVGSSAVAAPGRPPSAERAPRGGVTGYNVYRSGQPNVQTTPQNLYTSVPASQTTVNAPVGSSGSFFVVTAVSDTDESGASNEVPAGTPGATITNLKVKRTSIKATGTGFTATVQVFLDGIPFTSPAKVKGNRTKVSQKGPLITGQTVGAYKPSGSAVEVIFVNDDATITRKAGTIQ